MNTDLYPCVGYAEPLLGDVSEPGERAISPRSGAKDWSVDQFKAIKRPLIIGVTGGMASGKSTLARMLSGRGIAHVDADALVHQLMLHDADTIAAIGDIFPNAVITRPKAVVIQRAESSAQENFSSGLPRRSAPRNDGMIINRAALAAHISKHPEALSALEAILHPRVRALEEGAIAFARRNRLAALVLDIPLLFETDADALCDVVIVAHAPMRHRRARAFARVGMTEAKWNRLLDRQLPDHVRNHLADIVISTAIGKAATRKRIQALMRAWGLK